MKNLREIIRNRRTDKPMVIKSADARAYEAGFGWQVPGTKRVMMEGRLRLTVYAYYPNMRRDLDCEIIPDLLQLYGVIKNDRHIWEKHYYREMTKEKDGWAIITIETMPEPASKPRKGVE